MKSVLLLAMVMLFTACSDNFGSEAGRVGPEPLGPPNSKNGNEQGNGTDNLPFEAGAAWFYGDNLIQYCFVKSDTFPVSDGKIAEDLQAAFKTWENYIADKKINNAIQENVVDSLGGGFPEPERSQIRKEAEKLKDRFSLTTQSFLLPRCTGKEDVKFYFGATSEEVSEALKKYYNPTAFASRTAFNTDGGWSKGYVWVAERLKGPSSGLLDWSLPYRLRGILTHEIGHLYGSDHVEGTIMQANLTSEMGPPNSTSVSQSQVEYILTHIDGRNELFMRSLRGDSSEFKGASGLFGLDYEQIFNIFVGRKPVGPVSSVFKNGVLELTDTVGLTRIPIEMNPSSLISYSPFNVFRVYRTWWNEPVGDLLPQGLGTYLLSESQTYIGAAQNARGEKETIQVTRNLGYSPLMMFYFANGQRRQLFVQESLFAF